MGNSNYKILGRQTKVTQRSKHAIPCHAFVGEKSAMRPSKRQLAVLGARSHYYSEKRQIMFTVGTVDRYVDRYIDRRSGRHSIDCRSTLGG